MAYRDIVTVKEVSKILSISAYTIRKWAKSGKLKSRKAGTRYLFLYEDIINFVREGSVKCEKE